MKIFFDIDLINFSRKRIKLKKAYQFYAPKNKLGTLIGNIFNYAGPLTFKTEKNIRNNKI